MGKTGGFTFLETSREMLFVKLNLHFYEKFIKAFGILIFVTKYLTFEVSGSV